jgi:uncharacterized protein (DUF2249 family)
MSVSPALDLRQIAPPQRHALIFGTFADLLPGQSLELVNDHDPQPLKQQFQLRSPGEFNWTYLDQGPQVWRVQIAKTAKAKSSCCGGCCG